MVDTSLIIKLRQMTGAGMGDCKEALEECGGDLDKAVELLRKKGAKTAAKRADKEAKEGVIGIYLHSNKKMAAMVELSCETDFVARNEAFQELANDLAMQIVGSQPLYVKPEDIPEDILNKEREIIKEEVGDANKPAEVIEKIIEGKLGKYYQDVCLIKQEYVKDDSLKIEDLLNEKIAALGEKIEIGEFKLLQI